MDQRKNDWHITYGLYSVVGIQLAVSVVAGLFFGNYLDKKLGTLPWLTIVGLILGSIGGFYNLIRITSWHSKKKEN